MATSSNVSPQTGWHSQSTTPSPVFAFSASLNPLSIRLDRHNYNFWKLQMVSTIRAHNLEFVLGSNPCPSQSNESPDSNGSVVRTLNPEYLLWMRHDQFMVS